MPPASTPHLPVTSDLSGQNVLIAVTAGIAAYKSAALVSRLAQSGADVRVVMTQAATRFVGPLTFQSLSGHAVLTDPWQHDDRADAQHVGLGRWCDLMCIAPCTANTIGQISAGLTGSLVSLIALALPGTTPLILAPAMNADMWDNPVVQRNLRTLRDELPNLEEVGPETGWQACRTAGAGRMAEPELIFQSIAEKLRADRAS